MLLLKSNPNISFLNRNTLVVESGPSAEEQDSISAAVNAALGLRELRDRNQDVQILPMDLNYEQQVSVQESSGEGAPQLLCLPLVVQRQGCKVPINYPH